MLEIDIQCRRRYFAIYLCVERLCKDVFASGGTGEQKSTGLKVDGLHGPSARSRLGLWPYFLPTGHPSKVPDETLKTMTILPVRQ